MEVLNNDIRRTASLREEFITSIPERKGCGTRHRDGVRERVSHLSQEAELKKKNLGNRLHCGSVRRETE